MYFLQATKFSKKLYYKIKIPLKPIYGDNDLANKNNKNDTKDAFELASYNIIKNCGHFSFLEKPKEVEKSLVVKIKKIK